MEKTAVVLAGGGSRGAYQVGVWQAMRELSIPYHLVTGTSVGALNGVVMVQQEFDKAIEIWENIDSQQIFGLPSEQLEQLDGHPLRQMARGGVELAGLEKFVAQLVDEQRFWESPIDFALVTVEYPTMKPLELQKKDIPKGRLQEYLLASAACFPAFQVKEIDGKRYIDGGYHDNMPVNLALKMGADQVIAVDLESIGITRRVKSRDKKILQIYSLWPLGSFLKFDRALAARNIRLGYLDAKKAFGAADGQQYTFYKDSAFFYTPALRALSEKLFERARQLDERSLNILQTHTMQRMLRQFRKRALRTGRPMAFTLSRQMMMAAELLGEALELSPEKEYDFGDFLVQLRQAAAQARERFDPHTVGEELQKLDRATVVLWIRERIERVLKEGGNPAELLLAAAFWKEFAAAIFLYLIEQPDLELASLQVFGQQEQ